MMETVDKLRVLLPSRWFSSPAKEPGGILYAVLKAFAKGLDYIEEAAAYVVLQTRIKTATDVNLDNIALDFFGSRVTRRAGENDAAWRNRIIAEIFRDRVTRSAIKKAIEDTGATVVEIYEPFIDGFFTDYTYTDGTRISDANPYEGIYFVTRPFNQTVSPILYTDWNYTDFNYTPSADSNIWLIQDNDVFRVVEETKACGVRVWIVLDPIPVSETTTANYISDTRYYVPGITLPLPPIFTLDDANVFDDDAILR